MYCASCKEDIKIFPLSREHFFVRDFISVGKILMSAQIILKEETRTHANKYSFVATGS
jgi:hypothetical protein